MGWIRFVSCSNNTIVVLSSGVLHGFRTAVSWPQLPRCRPPAFNFSAASRSMRPAWEATPRTNSEISPAERWHLSDSEGVMHGPYPFSQRYWFRYRMVSTIHLLTSY